MESAVLRLLKAKLSSENITQVSNFEVTEENCSKMEGEKIQTVDFVNDLNDVEVCLTTEPTITNTKQTTNKVEKKEPGNIKAKPYKPSADIERKIKYLESIAEPVQPPKVQDHTIWGIIQHEVEKADKKHQLYYGRGSD